MLAKFRGFSIKNSQKLCLFFTHLHLNCIFICCFQAISSFYQKVLVEIVLKMANGLSIDNCLIQVRSCLQEEGIKLWLEPYHIEGIGTVDSEMEVIL